MRESAGPLVRGSVPLPGMRRLKHAGAGAAPVTAEGTVGEVAETGRSVAFLCRKPGLPGDGKYHSRRAVAAADRRGAFREPRSLLDWARRAEKRGFAFVSTIGRVGRPSYDSLTTLAAAAGATSRIGLVTNALLAPMHPDADLAELTMTLARLSGERCPWDSGSAPGSRTTSAPSGPSPGAVRPSTGSRTSCPGRGTARPLRTATSPVSATPSVRPDRACPS